MPSKLAHSQNIRLPKRRTFQGCRCRSLRSFHPAPSRIRAARAAYPQATTTALETRSSAGTANEPCRIPGRLQGRPSPREPNRGLASTSSLPCRWGARPRAAIPTSSRPSTAVEPLRIPHRGKTGALARRRNAARVPRARRPRRVDCPEKSAPFVSLFCALFYPARSTRVDLALTSPASSTNVRRVYWTGTMR